MFSPMPDLATGLTNILIFVSAFGCVLWLRKFENVQTWQALFIVVTLCGVMGIIAHCFVLPEKIALTVWVILDFLLGAAVTLMSLAAVNQCVGRPTWLATLLTTLLGIVTVFFMVKSELTDGSFNYPVVIITALIAVATVAVDCSVQLKQSADLARFKHVFPGILIMVAAGIPCIWFEYYVAFGPVIINQSAVLHLAIALGLPFICSGISSLLLEKEK